ncbi:MAG TPA: hypothetical protein VF615_21990 [Longimicrobiaceae bacterium]|jgi:hypothetical protein
MPFARWPALLCAFLLVCCETDAAEEISSHEHLFRRELPREMLGCLALYTGPGTPLDSTHYLASPGVRLDSVRPVGRLVTDTIAARYRVATALDPDGNPVGPRSEDFGMPHVWAADSLSDTLRVWFTNGYSSTVVALRFRVDADTLHGRLVGESDAGPPFITDKGRALAVRVACRGG